MRRILAEVVRCVRLLGEIKDEQTRIRDSLENIEGQLAELIDGDPGGTVTMNLGPVSEQNLTR